MPEVDCLVCGRRFLARGRGRICPDPDCRRARRRSYDAGVSAAVAGLPPPERVCEICGRAYPAQRSRKTCGDPACQRERKQRRWRANYHALPPEKKAAMIERAKQRRVQDPDAAHAQDARKWQRVKNDPQRLEQNRARAKEHYARHAARIQARRRARLERMTPEELGELVERLRGYTRAWQARQRSDPLRGPQRRAYEREYRRRRQAAEMAGDAATLAALLAGRRNAGTIKPCAVCGRPVVGRHPTAKTCSQECQRQRWLDRHRPLTEKTCAGCGRTFTPRTAAKTCSEECRRARRLGLPLDQLPPLQRLAEEAVCDVCGKTFHPWRAGQKGCSPDCRRVGRLWRKRASRRQGPYPPRPCAVCARPFSPDRHNGKVCPNGECRAEYKRRLERDRQRSKRHDQQEG